jgi:hypothetical protein
LSASNKAELLFKSSFDESYLTKPERQDSAIWWQEIQSSKKGEFNWPISIGGGEGRFQMIVNHENVGAYIENRIVEMKDKYNHPTKALLQEIKKKEYPWTQDPYTVYTEDKEQKKLYLRYSLRYPKNLSKLLGRDGWLTFCEYKTKSDYRLAFYIYSDKQSNLYWYAHGDNVVLENIPYEEYWYRENKKLSVPTGRWFDVEIFWKRSRGDDGRVWLAIDGKTVIDYQGVTKLKEPIHQMMLFTNYASVPFKQWVDNIEIWSDFPCGEARSCHNINKQEKQKR